MEAVLDRLAGADEATLVAGGSLGLLPLHAAWTADEATKTGRRYAIDVLPLSYAPNARALTAARALANGDWASNLLAVVEPRPVAAAPLPCAALEGEVAASLFPRAPVVLNGGAATAGNFKNNATAAGILHLGCHGFADLASPLESGVRLAGNRAVRLRDLLAMQLRVRLAVLSACETSLPGTELADEVVALPTGLLQAGVAGVVASIVDGARPGDRRCRSCEFSRATGPRMLRGRLPSLRRKHRAKLKKRYGELVAKQRRGGLSIPEYVEFLRLRDTRAQDPERLAELNARRASGFTVRDAAAVVRARTVVRNTPDNDALGMPTRLGDILRAAERRPLEKYGLDTIVCWTAMWLVMPPDARTEISQTRARLDGALRMWLWGALFVVWTPWTVWAIPIAVCVPALAYYGGILGAARLFGDLVATSFDLYRMQLYDSLQLPRPESPASEHREGAQLTNLLWGGLDDPSVKYVAPSSG